jgi:hypothetical protein
MTSPNKNPNPNHGEMMKTSQISKPQHLIPLIDHYSTVELPIANSTKHYRLWVTHKKYYRQTWTNPPK